MTSPHELSFDRRTYDEWPDKFSDITEVAGKDRDEVGTNDLR
jgi:hypothetical protein